MTEIKLLEELNAQCFTSKVRREVRLERTLVRASNSHAWILSKMTKYCNLGNYIIPIKITSLLIEQLKEKIAGSGLKTFYVLSTYETISPEEMDKLTKLLLEIRQNYGCQVIVNGVACTIRYYLRLLSDTDKFVYEYVTFVEDDSEVPFALKSKWNQVTG